MIRVSCNLGHRVRAFTLVEVMIVVVILGILAAIVLPVFSYAHLEARAKSSSANAHTVRELIQLHKQSGDYPVTAAGWPDDIYAAWFNGGTLPDNTWTKQPMNVEVVAAGENNIYPAVKTFDQYNAAAANAWYNTDNGHFVQLVPAQSTDAETLELFNLSNGTNATSLNQTTR